MKKVTLFIFVLVLLLVTPKVHATPLTLSTNSSSDSGYTAHEWLDAELDFVVDDIAKQLTFTATNTTDANPEDYQFDITQIFFNYGGNVTGLSFVGNVPGWSLTDSPDNIHVDGFGYFDVGLFDGESNPPKAIKPGNTATFVFNISATGSVSDADFTYYLSAENGGDTLGLAAAKFYNGGPQGNDWAYGMVVPEPATICLLGLGVLGLLRRRKSQ